MIIILIVVMIVQTCVFIYSNFIDINKVRDSRANAEIVADAQKNFIQEKSRLQMMCDAKDDATKQWIDKYNLVVRQLDEARKVNGLLKNRTAYIEGLKESFNHQAEGEWDSVTVFAEANKKSQRRCYVEGMKAGAEWICNAVGVKTEFEIDGRFDDEPDKGKQQNEPHDLPAFTVGFTDDVAVEDHQLLQDIAKESAKVIADLVKEKNEDGLMMTADALASEWRKRTKHDYGDRRPGVRIDYRSFADDGIVVVIFDLDTVIEGKASV